MSVVTTFAIGMSLGLVFSLTTVLVLRPHLTSLLQEVCGTRARASFWVVIATLSLLLFGALTSTISFGYPPARDALMAGTPELFFGLVTQLRSCLVGLLSGVLIVSWLLVGSIRRYEQVYGPPLPPHGAADAA